MEKTKLVQVGWNLPNRGGEAEYLVNLTDAQERELEEILKEAYHQEKVSDYWIADAVIFPFKTFMKKVIKK
jgi:hypothetical protein